MRGIHPPTNAFIYRGIYRIPSYMSYMLDTYISTEWVVWVEGPAARGTDRGTYLLTLSNNLWVPTHMLLLIEFTSPEHSINSSNKTANEQTAANEVISRFDRSKISAWLVSGLERGGIMPWMTLALDIDRVLIGIPIYRIDRPCYAPSQLLMRSIQWSKHAGLKQLHASRCH